jgi:hypothetical protein
MNKLTSPTLTLALLAAATLAHGQVPDVLNALDAGGRSLGMGGALEGTDPSTQSIYYNPAGLGYLKKMQIGGTWRNLPTSDSSISGTRSDPVFDTSGKSGGFAFTDLGFATGGFVNDKGVGPASGLADAGINIDNYKLNRSLETNFYTLAYGIANKAESFSFGLGLTYADVQVGYQESGTATDGSGNPVDFPGSSVQYDAHGFGAIAGIQIVPPSSPNISLGASVRSPIQLSNAGSDGIYDRVPGRALLSGSYRLDNLAHGDDFALIGAQVQYFFDGAQSIAFDQNGQVVYGVGAEYDHTFGTFRVPFRLGYETLGTGGIGFGSRNLITYGIGYRPLDSNYSIDLDWAHPDTGGIDMGITASYRFKQ